MGYNEKNITNLSSAELTQGVVKVKYTEIQSTLVILNFTGPDKNVRVISSSRQPNCDVIGMTTVPLCSPNVLGRHIYMAI